MTAPIQPGPGTPTAVSPDSAAAMLRTVMLRAQQAGEPISQQDQEQFVRSISGGRLGLGDLMSGSQALRLPVPPVAADDTQVTPRTPAPLTGNALVFNTARRLLEAKARAAKQGETVTPDDEAGAIAQLSGGKVTPAQVQQAMHENGGAVNGALSAALNGATFGWNDELAGKVNAVGHALLPSLIESGPDARERDRLIQSIFAQQHPVLSVLANIGGGFALPLGALGDLVKGGEAVGTLGRVARGASVGAGFGALAGAGNADDGNRLAAAGTGAVTGGLLGAAVPAIGAARDLLPSNIRALQSGAIPRLLATPVSDEATLGEAPAAKRVLDTLVKSRQQWAQQAYGALRNTDQTVAPADLASALGRPGVAAAWQRARLAGDIADDSPLGSMYERLVQAGANPELARAYAASLPNGTAGEPRSITFGDMLQFKRALDGKVSAAFRAGNGDLGNALSDVRNSVNDVLVKTWPDYAAVANEYGNRLRLETALKAGARLFNADPDEINNALQSLSPAEQNFFRAGMLARLRGAVAKATNVETLYRTFSTPAWQARLEAAFGNRDAFDRMMDAVTAEHQLAQVPTPSLMPTKYQLGGGAVLGMLHHPGVAAAEIAASPVAGLTRTALALRSARSSAAALGSRGDAITALLNRLSSPQPYGIPLAAGLGAGSGYAVPGLLNGGGQ